MDVFSHGLWGALAFGRQGNAFLAAAFGMAPDLIPFTPDFIANAVDRKVVRGKPELTVFPEWVVKIYNFTHSLVVYAVIYILIRIIWGNEIAYLSLAWLLHILFDIPTHAKEFFPTKFLYPLSNFHFDGIPWANKKVLLGNFLLLALFYGLFFAGVMK